MTSNAGELEAMMDKALGAPTSAIAYEMNRALRARADGQTVLESGSDLEVFGFAKAGHAEAELAAGVPNEVLTQWIGHDEGLADAPENAWLVVTFEGKRYGAARLSFRVGFERTVRWWLWGDVEADVRRLLERIAAWSTEVHGEILVFQDGCFQKSERLHREVQRASWDDLVLHGGLKEEIARDFEQFFALRETYARHGAAWRRGALFLGPPGNGKTHCVKALVKRLAKPTLYVRGFRHRYRTTADCIQEVFVRARHLAPCVLVLEDLDGLFDPEGLAFFLNELDGFGENSGILTLGTTNHPERLDPALLDRPSRFDRTYAFALPGDEERRQYFVRQADRLATIGGLGPAAIDELVSGTRDFSFAYLKELVISALLSVAGGAAPDAETVMRATLPKLREQLGQARALAPKRDPAPPSA